MAKGGTGKTTIAIAFAEVAKDKIIIDADEDVANMHFSSYLLHKFRI